MAVTVTARERIERMRADLDEYRAERPQVWIVCRHHKRPHRIALFGRTPEGEWHHLKGTSAASKQEHARNPVGEVPTPDKRPPRAMVRGDEPLARIDEAVARLDSLRPRPSWEGEPPPDPREVFDLTCPRCRRVRRHASFQRRADGLWPLLDLLAGQRAREATPELLAAMVRESDAPRNPQT